MKILTPLTTFWYLLPPMYVDPGSSAGLGVGRQGRAKTVLNVLLTGTQVVHTALIVSLHIHNVVAGCNIMKTCPCNIQRIFSEAKIENFIGKILILFNIFDQNID